MFKGKTVIITGASSGLGKELGRRLIRKGANLALFARSSDKLAGVKNELETIAQQNQKIKIFSCDVSNFNEIEKVVGQIADTVGLPDILIKCLLT